MWPGWLLEESLSPSYLQVSVDGVQLERPEISWGSGVL